jgi:hypothetical protein
MIRLLYSIRRHYLKSKVYIVLASNVCVVWMCAKIESLAGTLSIKTDQSGITLGDINSYLSTFCTKPEAKVLDHCREPGTTTRTHDRRSTKRFSARSAACFPSFTSTKVHTLLQTTRTLNKDPKDCLLRGIRIS